MIARIWNGAVRRSDGDAYADYMRKTGIQEYASTPGNCGVWMLRRDVEQLTEFQMFTLWDSLEAVKAFAGDDYETAVFYPEDDYFLVERDLLSSLYTVDTRVSPPGGEAMGGPGQRVQDHIAAFNAHDLDRLMACFSADVTWVTGSDRFHGTAELAQLFDSAFRELSPKLTIDNMAVEGDHVACELSEHVVVDDVTRVDHIAGFYQVQSERITAVKIYREGSAGP